MAESAPETIEIEGHLYSLGIVPDEKSAIVLSEQNDFLGQIDLETLVTDLGLVGGFIRIAYNGVGAAGSKFTDQQVTIQRRGYDVTNLCNKAVLTVTKFKKASRSIVIELQATYAYLLDNLEEMAVETLSAVSKIAGDMSEAALDLSKDFDREADQVVLALNNTEKAKQTFDEHKTEKKDEQEKLEADLNIEKQMITEKKKEVTEAKNRRKKLELEEDKAMSQIREMSGSAPVVLFKEFFNGLTTGLTGKSVFMADGERTAKAKKEQRLEALKSEQDIRNKRHEAIVRMSDFTVKIKQCKTEDNMSQVAVMSLHEAAGALKHLSAVMSKATLFWQKMHDHCESLAKYNMQSQVKKAIESYDSEKRLKVWTSKGFKTLAIRFYAKWVALHGVCDVYMERIKITQKELYRYLTENPTWEQSRENLPELVAKFQAILIEDEKAISEQDSKAQEEIKSLKE